MAGSFPIASPDLTPIAIDGRGATFSLTDDRVTQIRHELETICNGTAFHTSRKSCEFLRFIVQRTLDGDATSLKERTVGVELLGRASSYDTGSDAAVRVRANEVRRRLRLHYNNTSTPVTVKITVPTGSYLPQFLFASVALPLSTDLKSEVPVIHKAAPESLSLSLLALPTLIALFLCAICIRWHFLPPNPAGLFWQSLLAGRSEMVIDERPFFDAASPSSQGQDFRILSPLLSVAGRYSVTAVVRDAAERLSPDALYIDIELGKEDDKWTSLAIDCDQPCRMVIRGGTRKQLEHLTEALANTNAFPPELAASVESPRTWHAIRSGQAMFWTLALSGTSPPSRRQ